MPLQKHKAVYVTRERQNTPEDGEVQIPWHGIHE